jgi:hypothetical protein
MVYSASKTYYRKHPTHMSLVRTHIRTHMSMVRTPYQPHGGYCVRRLQHEIKIRKVRSEIAEI